MIVPNESKLQETYELFSEAIPDKKVFAYKFSGNFRGLKLKFFAAEAAESILILTTHALLRYWTQFPALQNLIIMRLPFEASGKPSLLGISQREIFLNHVLPRGVHILYRMLSQFHSSGGVKQKIYILDSRLLTDYERAFLNYLEEFPDYEISTV